MQITNAYPYMVFVKNYYICKLVQLNCHLRKFGYHKEATRIWTTDGRITHRAQRKLCDAGSRAVLPLWKINTTELANRFYEPKFRSITCCVCNKVLNEEFAGKVIDPVYVESLRALDSKSLSALLTGETIFRKIPGNNAETKQSFRLFILFR